jgi:hypothetical protein
MPDDVAVTDQSRRCRPPSQADGRRRLRSRRCAIALAVATAALTAPAGALAADPPTILSAGINAQDNLYATYAVAPGTTFDFITFATVPDPDPTLPSFFADGNFAGFCSSTSASATCTATSYVSGYGVSRDRRYFAKVSAKVDGTTNTYLSSAIWVMDDAKPQIPGPAGSGAIPPVGPAVAGHPLGTAAPPPPAVAGVATIKLLSKPKTIGALLLKGVRLRIACTVACSAFGRLTLGSPSIGTKAFTLPAAGTKTLTIKPNKKGRTRLKGRSRARIKVAVGAAPVGGTTKTYSKAFTVKRR